MIRFNLGKFGRFHIDRPTLSEIAGLALVLCFLLVLASFWR